MYTPEQYGIFLLWNVSVLFFIFFRGASLLKTGLYRLAPTNINPLEKQGSVLFK